MYDNVIFVNRLKYWSFFIYFVICLSGFLACGYSLVGRGRSLPSTIQTIAIPVLFNKTSEPNIEIMLSKSIRNEFIFDGRLKVVDSESADLILKGEVKDYSLKPISFGQSNKVKEYWVELTVKIEVINIENEDEPLIKNEFSSKASYEVFQDISSTESNRVSAINQASKIVAQKVISILIEGF